MTESTHPPSQHGALSILRRADVLSGLTFIGFAVFGLAVSWNYPIGTAVRMGTGYVPRLMLWILLALGLIVLFIGLRKDNHADAEQPPPLQWRPLVFVPLSLIIYSLGMANDLGFIVSGMLLILVAGAAYKGARIWEVIVIAVALVFSCWAIFVWALGLVIPVWPGG